MKKFLKQYAPHIGASAIAITAVATAAVTPLPGSLPASVSTGGTILAADINAMIDSLNILDQRTDGDMPVDNDDLVDLEYLDGEIATINTAISNAGDDLGDHTATQNIDGGGNAITNITAPTDNADAANKEYVDGAVAASGGGTMPTGFTGIIGSDGFVTYGCAGTNYVRTDATQSWNSLHLPYELIEVDSLACGGNGIQTNDGSEITHLAIAPSSTLIRDAATYCDTLSEAGYDDWRLPNTALEAFYAEKSLHTENGDRIEPGAEQLSGLYDYTQPTSCRLSQPELGGMYYYAGAIATSIGGYGPGNISPVGSACDQPWIHRITCVR